MMPPFVVFPTNRIAHFVEVSLYLFYLAQQVNLIDLNAYSEAANTYVQDIAVDNTKTYYAYDISYIV